MNRFAQMQQLLDECAYFKLVCGAGNEDKEEIKKLSLLYTLAGAKGIDLAADPETIRACREGIDLAFSMAERLGFPLETRPFIMVSVGMPGDHHVRKAAIINDLCTECNMCIPVCPTDAIPGSLIVIDEKCIGCGNCEAICPVEGAIIYRHNARSLEEILPLCLAAGAEHVELHAAIADDRFIMEEWGKINRINPDNHNSICLDRVHLSNFALGERIKKAQAVAGERLIVQADGYPMSGGSDDFNTTLQTIATADVINKQFNKTIDKSKKIAKYKKNREVSILLSGGTNSLTKLLADMSDVKFQGNAIGTYARKIVKEYTERPDFFENHEVIRAGALKAKSLVMQSIEKPIV